MIAPFTPLSDETLSDFRRRIVEANGNLEAAGLTLGDIRNMIYTKCLKVNPNIEASLQQDGEDKPKARKKSVRGPTTSGAALDDLLG